MTKAVSSTEGNSDPWQPVLTHARSAESERDAGSAMTAIGIAWRIYTRLIESGMQDLDGRVKAVLENAGSRASGHKIHSDMKSRGPFFGCTPAVDTKEWK